MAYYDRAIRAQAANDLDQCVANLELSTPCYRDAERIYRATNHAEAAERAARCAASTEEKLRQIALAKAAAAAAATRG